MTQAEHMEVAPRMWDKTIAATYTPSSKKSPPARESDDEEMSMDTAVVPKVIISGGALSLMDRLKTYLLPAFFIICLLVVVYVIWTYFTKYRNARKPTDTTIMIGEEDIKQTTPKTTIDPQTIVQSEDMSKYEYDSDDDSVTPSKDRLSVIEEEDEELSIEQFNESSEDDSVSDEESEDDSVSDEESDDEGSLSGSSPDIAAIEELISATQFDDNLDNMPPLIEDEFSFEIPSYINGGSTSTKTKRKQKRVTL
jgi:hypothetical protein